MNAAAEPEIAVRTRLPSALVARIRLGDGREVVVRPVLPADAAALQQFVRSLSLDSRRLRFHAQVRGLLPSLLQRAPGLSRLRRPASNKRLTGERRHH